MGILYDYCAKNFCFNFVLVLSILSVPGFNVDFICIFCKEILIGSSVRANKLHTELYVSI